MKFFTCLSHAHPYEELYENSFFPQAACVTIAALIQYFLSLLLRCESLQHQHQNVHVSRHLMG